MCHCFTIACRSLAFTRSMTIFPPNVSDVLPPSALAQHPFAVAAEHERLPLPFVPGHRFGSSPGHSGIRAGRGTQRIGTGRASMIDQPNSLILIPYLHSLPNWSRDSRVVSDNSTVTSKPHKKNSTFRANCGGWRGFPEKVYLSNGYPRHVIAGGIPEAGKKRGMCLTTVP